MILQALRRLPIRLLVDIATLEARLESGFGGPYFLPKFFGNFGQKFVPSGVTAPNSGD